MNTLSHLSVATVQAVTQPTPDPGPFEGIFSKFLGLLWATSGVVALAALLGAVMIYVYQKMTMQQSSALSWIGGTLTLIAVGAGAAQIVNWAAGT